MSGQIALSTHDVGAASSASTATQVQARTLLPPLSRSASTEQCESKQCHPSSEIREGKSNDYRDGAAEGTAPPKQPKLPTAFATQQEASAQERHDAKGEDNTRNSHPPTAGRNEYHTYEKPDEGNNNNSAAAEPGNTRIVTMNLCSKVASVTAEMSTKADDSAPLTDELFADMESTPSSPSKKKKKNKKKKKRKSSPEKTPSIQTKPSDSSEQVVQDNSSVHKDESITKQPGTEPASGSESIALLTDNAGKDTPFMPDEAIPTVDTHAVHQSRSKSERSCGSKSSGRPDEYVTDAPLNTNSHKFDTSDTTEKKELTQSNESSTPIDKELPTQENHACDPDDGAWETVEKPRCRRKKGPGGGGKKVVPVAQTNTKSPSSHSNTNNTNGQNNDGTSVHNGRVRRTKRYNRDKNRNNNNNNNQQSTSNNQQQNKFVKDVILHILDAVDVEVRANRTKSHGNYNLSHLSNGGHRRHQLNGDVESSAKLPAPSMVSNSSATSLRDIVLGTSTASSAQLSKNSLTAAQAKGAGGNSDQPSNGSSKVKPGMSYKSVIEPAAAVSKTPQPPQPQHQPPAPKPNAWAKPPSDIKLKQNDELKKKSEVKSVAVHTSSEKPSQNTRLVGSAVADEGKEKLLSATSDNGETQHRHSVSTVDDDGSPPPLATLLGPGTSCSASSSVASSLEAPHSSANRFRHQSSANSTEDDVGYHLLNVCGQLSEEINTFMSRRALALDIRRKERNAVLNALGDTLTKIWPGQCRVEMYGSCATQLDLPSSDLDLVVCGLDDVVGEHMIPAPPLIDQSSHNLSSNNFAEQDESSQECVSLTNRRGGQIPSSPTVNEQQIPVARSSSTGSFLHKAGEDEQLSSDSLASDYVIGGDRTGSVLVESGENDMVTGVEYSPGRVSVENYSPDYESVNHGEVAATEGDYSPGFSYHSQENIATDNYTMGYGGEDTNLMEGYDGQEYQTNGQEFYYASPYSFVSSLSINAQRVLRLASELELQPWAVQVKAIPTATVPVVKMLADPSKLPGLVGTGGNWRMKQPTPISPDQISSPTQQCSVLPSSAHFFSPHPMITQWRGADIMNGLQPVDITFEGPEHGGIGSTTYSARVVQDACEETGLAPESTPVVQVASVLKELLAQRRLNEPFSGGLSSYGLLLLLLAVLKDRKIIQEEMKKMEKQRQLVKNDESRPPQKERKQSHPAQKRSTLAGTQADPVNPAGSASSPGADSSDKSSATPSTTSKPNTSSSWASIAKKSNASTARTDSLSTITKSTVGSASARTIVTKTVGEGYINNESRRQENSDVCLGKSDKIISKKQSNANVSKKGDLNVEKKRIPAQGTNSSGIDGPSVVISQVTSSSEGDSCKILRSSNGPQGSNDVLEVLCSGELTSGKLLMHFLLFFGQHFDARLTLIDINGTHNPQYGMVDFDRLSPFVPRPPGGTIDPITGMFSVDPIVVYDPLEGAVDHNVSKRCYCWNNVKWVFAQCYMTVSSIVENSDACTTRLESIKSNQNDVNETSKAWRKEGKSSSNGKPKEEPEPILEHFLSF